MKTLLIIFGVPVGIALILIASVQIERIGKVLVCSQVVSVGGCDRNGTCGVKLASGSYTSAVLPVVGRSVCVWEEK